MHQPHTQSALRSGAQLLQRACCALLALALALVALPAPARAAEADGSLTLQMQYVSGSTTTPIAGAMATAYLVADLDDALNTYTLRSEFAQLDVNFNEDMSADLMARLAAQAADIVSSAKVKGAATATSDAKGTLAFGTLPKGIYLVLQTGATGKAKDYTALDPFLISVPQITAEGVVFDVTALPKVGIKPPDKMPQTNDPFDLRTVAGCLAVGGALVVAGLVGRRSGKAEDEANGQ